MIRKRVSWDENGDPVLKIEVTGHSDVYRLACHLRTGQVEFARTGAAIQESLRRRWGAAKLRTLDRTYWGRGGHQAVMVAGERARLRRLLALIQAAGPGDTWLRLTERLPVDLRELWADEVDATTSPVATAERWWRA